MRVRERDSKGEIEKNRDSESQSRGGDWEILAEEEVLGAREVAKAASIPYHPTSTPRPHPRLAQPTARSRARKVAQSSRLSRAEWLAVRSARVSGLPATGPRCPA